MERPNTPHNNSEHGFLILFVTEARGSLPIAGARVTVRPSDDKSDLLYTATTDRSGRTEKLSLPAPPAADSQVPGGKNVYAAYDIEVTHSGFYPGLFFGVPVFANTTSIQPVSLVPYSAYEPEKNRPDLGIDFKESEDLAE